MSYLEHISEPHEIRKATIFVSVFCTCRYYLSHYLVNIMVRVWSWMVHYFMLTDNGQYMA